LTHYCSYLSSMLAWEYSAELKYIATNEQQDKSASYQACQNTKIFAKNVD